MKKVSRIEDLAPYPWSFWVAIAIGLIAGYFLGQYKFPAAPIADKTLLCMLVSAMFGFCSMFWYLRR